MSDTILKQEAIEALDQIFDRCEEIEAHLPEGDPDRTGYKMYPDYMIVWEYLHQLSPTESEIVRCKNCKHWKNKHLCESLSRFGSFETKADFYCGYAERRTND